jgi:hypothetical protein
MTPMAIEPDSAVTYKTRAKWQFVRWLNVAGTVSVSQDAIVFEPNIISRISMLSMTRMQLYSIGDLIESTLHQGGRQAVRRNGPVGARRLVALRFRYNKEVAVLVKDPDALLNALHPHLGEQGRKP